MIKSFKEHLNEASIGRLNQHVQNRNMGIITANRGENTGEENLKKNKELEGDIKKHKFGFVHVQGRYIENKGTSKEKAIDSEHSYVVIGKKGHDNGALKGFLLKHGAKYGQDSVLHKPHDSQNAKFLYTRNVGDKKVGDSEDVGKFHPKAIGDYHSKLMHSKKSFSFANEDVIKEYEFLIQKSPITFFKGEEIEI